MERKRRRRGNDGWRAYLEPLFKQRENAAREWLVATGNRRAVAGVLLVGVFCSFLALSVANPVDLATLLTERSTVQTLLNTMLSGDIVLVSIVVTVNYLSVWQELSSIGGKEQRIQTAMEFRERAESLIDDSDSPSEAAEFLAMLIDATRRRAEELQEANLETDEGFERQYEGLMRTVSRNADEVTDSLERTHFSPFDAVYPLLSYDYSGQLNMANRLQRSHSGSFPEPYEETFDRLVETITLTATMLEYFKTLYYQDEFANLSLDLLYSGLPAVVTVSYVLVALDAPGFSGATFGVRNLHVFVSLGYTLSLLPFVVLTAYMLRAAAVTKRTLAPGPFLFD